MVLKKTLLHKKLRNCDIQGYNIYKSSTNIVFDSKQLFPKPVVKEQTEHIWYF